MPAQGEPTVTLLLRHGQTPMSVQKRYAGRSDVPLTDTGVRQAAAAAKRLASAGIGVIVTSPLQRAVQTAEEVAAVTGTPVVTDDGFRETDFGVWEGLTFAEVRERWPSEMTAWLADPAVAPPGGESFAEVSERVTTALNRVLADRGRQTVLIVSHVTPIKTLVAAALLAPPAALYRMHLDVAALCEVDWYPDGPAVLRSFNDTAHLDTDIHEGRTGGVLPVEYVRERPRRRILGRRSALRPRPAGMVGRREPGSFGQIDRSWVRQVNERRIPGERSCPGPGYPGWPRLLS